MWGWAILAFLLGAAFRRAFDVAGFAPATVRQTRARVALSFCVAAFLCLIVLAILNDGAWLPKWGWAVYSVVVSPRFVACVSGFLIGALLSGSTFLRQVASIVLPIPAWAVATATSIFLIVGVVLAVNPSLLDSLQTLKAGGIEATFASRAANVRETEIHLNDVAQKLTLKQYLDFKDRFVDANSARRKATEWFDKSQVKDDRLIILTDVFDGYVNPIVLALNCLDEKEALDGAKRQESLIRLALAWQGFLLGLNKQTLTKHVSNAFFENIERLSNSFLTYARENGEGCSTYNELILPKKPILVKYAQDIWKSYSQSAATLSASGTDKNMHALAAMEPYVVGLAADLLAFVFGQKEKADFLERITERFPLTDDLLQTGIINLFYQLADAKIQSEVSWPIEKMTEQLDYTLRGADSFVSQSLRRKRDYKADGKVADEIADVYNTNAFLILAQNLAMYNQRSLRGEPIGEVHSRRWTELLGRILAIMHARLRTLSPIEGVSLPPLDSDAAERWRSIKLGDSYLIDANIAIALSLILHHPENQNSASECSSARYYLRSADKNRRNLYDTKQINHSEDGRLEQFIRVVGYRIGSRCAQRN